MPSSLYCIIAGEATHVSVNLYVMEMNSVNDQLMVSRLMYWRSSHLAVIAMEKGLI